MLGNVHIWTGRLRGELASFVLYLEVFGGNILSQVLVSARYRFLACQADSDLVFCSCFQNAKSSSSPPLIHNDALDTVFLTWTRYQTAMERGGSLMDNDYRLDSKSSQEHE